MSSDGHSHHGLEEFLSSSSGNREQAEGSSGLLETTDYFGFAPEKAIFGSRGYSFADEAALYEQWDWYKTSANRIKKLGDTGSACDWWECSPCSNSSSDFCFVNSEGIAGISLASNTCGLAPFGCI